MVSKKRRSLIAWVTLIAIAALPLSATAQTQIKYHSNKFSVQDDVKLGRQAAQEAEQQFPLLNDEQVRGYVETVGRRLVNAIPPEFQHPEFNYYFKVVNARDINAFALPGGPMYVNRGMIEAAKTEGEMAGVMAHELSHVALRHGTAQATKAQKYGTLAAIAGIAGAIATRNPGVGQLAQAPFAVYLLKFSREYETEADLLGSQIMARAGYDPRDLANMFRTLQQQGGGGGGFLSDHPSPSDRYARIEREAQSLRVNAANSQRDSRAFARIQERLRGYQRAPTMSEIAQSGQRYPTGENTSYPSNAPTGRVEYPSSRYQSVSIFGGVQLSVPSNWRQLNEGNSVWFVPEGGYGQVNGQPVFTHGVNFGVAQTNSRNLQQGTNELINSLGQGNNNLRTTGGYQRTTVDGHQGLWTSLSNVNEATGRPETVRVITAQLRNGQLFYMIAVQPQNERNFEGAFQNVLRSLRIND